MMNMHAMVIALLALAGTAFGFVSERTTVRSTATRLAASRRGFLANGAAAALALLFADASLAEEEEQVSSLSSSAAAKKVLVLGGTGMVGSEVVKLLQAKGVQVIATSTNGRDGTVALDFRDKDLGSKIESLAKGCTAVISCVGVFGTDRDAVINAASGIAAGAAKKVGVKHFAYISVAPEVREFGKRFDFLESYMEGKAYSEAPIVSAFGGGDDSSYMLIEPTFIYGGDKFGLKPPRVASGYGQFIESLLASGPFRAATKIAPEGFIKITLEPPVSATTVAKAAIAGALGKSSSVLDTYDKIVEASKLV